MAAVAAFHTVVDVKIVCRAERGVVEALQPERLAQVLFERVQRVKMRRQSGETPFAHAPELLKSGIDEQRDIAADNPAGAVHLYASAGEFANYRAAAVSGHPVGFIGAPEDLETGIAKRL